MNVCGVSHGSGPTSCGTVVASSTRCRPRITTCVQNLAAYSFSTADQRDDLQARATWAMVELVKLALDARSRSRHGWPHRN